MTRLADGGTTVDPVDRDLLRRQLEEFAGVENVTEQADGTLRAAFSRSTYVAVAPDGHVTTGMPLHSFDAAADRLRFDHDGGELHVTAAEKSISYTFRRP